MKPLFIKAQNKLEYEATQLLLKDHKKQQNKKNNKSKKHIKHTSKHK